MASLTVRTPDGKTRTVNLLKRITSIGRGDDNDVKLEDPKVPDNAIHIVFDGSRYQVGSHGVSFFVNGKKRDEHVLAAADVIRVGDCELTFGAAPAPMAEAALSPTRAKSDSMNPDEHTAEVQGVPGREFAALRRLTAFSEKLLAVYELDKLL